MKKDKYHCLGYSYQTDCGTEYDCGYDTDILCDDCVFVVGKESNDMRKGKRPWAKCNQRDIATRCTK